MITNKKRNLGPSARITHFRSHLNSTSIRIRHVGESNLNRKAEYTIYRIKFLVITYQLTVDQCLKLPARTSTFQNVRPAIFPPNRSLYEDDPEPFFVALGAGMLVNDAVARLI